MSRKLIAGMSVLGAVVVAAIAVETTLLLNQDNSKSIIQPVAIVTPVATTIPTTPSPSLTKPVPTTTTPKPKASTKTVYVHPRTTYRPCNYSMGCAWGTFTLTKYAHPGPIHAYDEPSDASSKLYPIFANESVTVYCSVIGQDLQGHSRWDWVGDGWVWDHMVDTEGMAAPMCDDY